MRLSPTAADIEFEQTVAAFIAEHLDPAVQHRVANSMSIDKATQADWTRKLAAAGWAAPNWPVEYGGTGWSMRRRHQFEVLMRGHNAPETQGFGFNMVGPAIIQYGSAEQKAHYLPLILNAEISWCQGYSEPGAGSDLASLTTRAEIVGDEYRVNGAKIWTSGAERADHIFVLVRTDVTAKKQLGISFLLIPMTSAGIRVEALYAFNGKRLWNQVFFDDVMVPRSNRLGAENQGWTVAKTLLGDERLMVSRVAENKRILARVRGLLKDIGLKDAALAAKTAQIEIRLTALEATALRVLSRFDGGGKIGAEPSMLKLQGSQLVQVQDQLLFEIAGLYGLPLDAESRQTPNAPIHRETVDMIGSALFHHRGYTIAGGASEVQRNIIAQQVLGL
ncbi:MAG: acyl-CoA dehydrogenase family protein [Pseudomonadales bacterium]|nr:acyl-CoA dehydrogenase family protein [Pseudomonadales bacterium]